MKDDNLNYREDNKAGQYSYRTNIPYFVNNTNKKQQKMLFLFIRQTAIMQI